MVETDQNLIYILYPSLMKFRFLPKSSLLSPFQNVNLRQRWTAASNSRYTSQQVFMRCAVYHQTGEELYINVYIWLSLSLSLCDVNKL